jgi:type IV pilus assembly protein PilW
MKIMQLPRSQIGISIIEIMIALLIGAFLIGGLMQMFIGSKRTYNMQDANSRLQENGRFAAEFLAQDVHDANFWGCLILSSTSNDSLSGVTGNLGIAGSNDNVDPNIVKPTDSIFLSGLRGAGVSVMSSSNGLTPLTISAGAGSNLSQGDWVAVSDCDSADVFQITNDPGNGTVINHDNNSFAHTYGTTAQIFPWYSVTYDIQQRKGKLSLYRTELDPTGVPLNPTQELVEGIENMQILYGEDIDTDSTSAGYGLPDYYVPADQVVNMANVKGVRISLLAASTNDNLVTQAVPYTYNGETITPTDLKIRNVYDITLAVRSRIK